MDASLDVSPSGGQRRQFELSPIEKNARRRYIRFTMVMKWERVSSILERQLRDAKACISKGFFNALANWPVLGGEFVSSETHVNIVRLYYPRDNEQRERHDLLVFDDSRAGDGSLSPLERERLNDGQFDRSFFVSSSDPEPGDCFPPVTLKASFVLGAIVCGFAFNELIFDIESIRSFFIQFIDNTHDNDPGPLGIKVRVTPRELWSGRPNTDLFSQYRFNNGATEERTPRKELCYQTFFIKGHAVNDLIKYARESSETLGLKGLIKKKDCVTALMWIMIMRARYKNSRFDPDEFPAQLNINFSAATKAQFPKKHDVDYFGNTTVTAVAYCAGEQLILAPEDPGAGLPGVTEARQYGMAVRAIRDAIEEVNMDYVNHLVTLKREMPAEDDWAAYDRGVDLHSNGVVLEDWTEIGGDRCTGIPHAKGWPVYCPCFEDAEEGKIILLPRPGGHYGPEAWPVWVCLAEDDMDILVDQLDQEGWYIEVENKAE